MLSDEQGHPCGVIVSNRAGRQAVLAKTIIDATPRAMVARGAGGQFRPYPAGPHTFRRVVIGGQPAAAPGMTVRRSRRPSTGRSAGARPQAAQDRGHGRARQGAGRLPHLSNTPLRLPMSDAGPAAWARAEQQARTLTYHVDQEFTSDELFEVPPDAMHGRAAVRRPVAGGCRLPLDCLPAGGRAAAVGAGRLRRRDPRAGREAAAATGADRAGPAGGRSGGPGGGHAPAPAKVRMPAAADGSPTRCGSRRRVGEFLGGVRPVGK